MDLSFIPAGKARHVDETAVTSMALNRQMQISLVFQAMEVLNGDDGIILGNHDRSGDGQTVKGLIGERIMAEVLTVVTEVGIIGHNGLGKFHARPDLHHGFKIVKAWEKLLFLEEGSLPFLQKVPAINR